MCVFISSIFYIFIKKICNRASFWKKEGRYMGLTHLGELGSGFAKYGIKRPNLLTFLERLYQIFREAEPRF